MSDFTGSSGRALDLDEFLRLSKDRPIFDVRSPSEFRKGHIPGALNLPLFSDSQRAEVGTLYAKEGREKALLAGLDFVGPRMRPLVEAARRQAPEGRALVHCWRGGMRSSSIAWLLEFAGFKIAVLKNGYKSFRNQALSIFEKPHNLMILGGKTGSGKTRLLAQLQADGQQIIDLEGLAGHKGSAFGAIGLGEQPTQEQFENDLALELDRLDPQRIVWLEDESRNIGYRQIPKALFERMRESPTIFLDIAVEPRLSFLLEEYRQGDPRSLIDSVSKIQKSLGGLETRRAIEAIQNDDFASAGRIVLGYYDRTYNYGLSLRRGETVRVINSDSVDSKANALLVLEAAKDLRF